MGFFSRSDDRRHLTDEQAVERYRYMLRTAPPDTIEQAHEEAFSRLSRIAAPCAGTACGCHNATGTSQRGG